MINPASGKKEENRLEEQIDEQAGISGFDYQLYYMHGGNVIKDISRRIYSYKPQIVAAAGGGRNSEPGGCLTRKHPDCPVDHP